jgi:chromate transporter
MMPENGNSAPQAAPAAESPAAPAEPLGLRLRQLAWLFLKLGTTAFGGPAAHVAMMQEEVVERRKWLTTTEFLDMYAAANFIPGPNSTEMTIFIGHRRAGWRGLIVAGMCFILPAALLCTAIAALYVAWGRNPVSVSILWGVKPVVIAVVAQALFRLGKSAVKSWLLAAVALVAMEILFLQDWLAGQAHELTVLFGAGLVVAFLRSKKRPGTNLPLLALPLGQATLPAAAAFAGSAPLWTVFLIFLKIGAVLFGSGYVLLAFLQADFVDRHHWLTQEALLDAVAVGQATPGPVFTTATFIGYVVAGPWGALVATVGIFLPAFGFVAASAPLLPRLRKSPFFAAFLDGLNVASLALMAVVLCRLAAEALGQAGQAEFQLNRPAAMVAAGALFLLVWKNVNSIWLILAGAALGIVHTYL